MNNNEKAHVIFVTKRGDNLFLATSIDLPRFCVGGATESETIDKAQRALDYFVSSRDGKIRQIGPADEVRVITPIYEKKELRVA